MAMVPALETEAMNGKITQFAWEVLSSCQHAYLVEWRDPEGHLVASELVDAPSAGEAVARTATATVVAMIHRQQ